ncbi:GIY-YIG catalytic domain-containing protein [Arthrobacter sp. NIO-1057]|nr:GIY-YIG catalytic domain-containing protein [Arthrobacter sp. NIO-1057]
MPNDPSPFQSHPVLTEGLITDKVSTMTLTLDAIFRSAEIDPAQIQVIRHSFVREHEDSGLRGIHADSSDEEILAYTARQSSNTRVFPAVPPTVWVIFIKEGGDRARFWAVVRNVGEVSTEGPLRQFNLEVSNELSDLKNRLVIGWRSPRAWRLNGPTASQYPVIEIADSQPIPFPGFDNLVLDYPNLQAIMREHRYASWRTALSSVIGIYLITDTLSGRHYVGKADGSDSIRQRWSTYAANGHGANVELRGLDPENFRFSLLRVFDPSTPTRTIDKSESHFKIALDSRKHGLNRN